MKITHKHIEDIFEYDGSQINPSWAFTEFGIYGSCEGDDIFVDGKKLSISIASISLSSAKIHFALNLEDKGTPGDVETIGLYDIDEGNVFNEKNLKTLIFDVVNRYIDELETIEKDISKTKVLL